MAFNERQETSRSPLRVGIVGANSTKGWAPIGHIPALRALDEYEIIAVATTRMESAQASAEALGVPLAFADVGQLASHPDVDVVAVTVKVPEHYELVRAALEAGKHVFSEWPLCANVTQAAELAALAQKAGVSHIVGLQGYHAPGPLFVRELIDQGAIGVPQAVSFIGVGSPAPRQVPAAHVYNVDVAGGATVLSVSGGHLLATLAQAVGRLRSVSGVVAALNREATIIETGERLPVTSPDQVAMAGFLDNGAVLSIALQGGTARAAGGFELRIVGTEATLVVRPASPGGTVHIHDWAVTIAKADGTSEALAVPDRLVPAALASGPARNVGILYQTLARGINDGAPVTPDFQTAVEFHQTLDAIQRASATGAVQEL